MADTARDKHKSRSPLRLLRRHTALRKEPRDIRYDPLLHPVCLLRTSGIFLLRDCPGITDSALHGTHQHQDIFRVRVKLAGHKVHRRDRLRQHNIVEEERARAALRLLVVARNDSLDEFHHERNHWKPYQCADNIKRRVCIRDLTGNDINLTPFRGDPPDKLREPRDEEHEDNRAADIEETVRDCSPLRIFRLANRRKKSRDSRSNVIAEQDRNCAGESYNRGYAVRPRLRRKILQDSDGRRAALDDKRHTHAEKHTENRDMPDLAHEINKECARGERLHHGSHDIDSFKQNAEGENNHADVLPCIFFREEAHHEADKNDRIDVVADLEREELRRHRCSDIRAENDGNRLRQCHEVSGHETDDHDRRRRTALQNRCDEHACNRSHNRISRKKCENFFHFLARRALQGVAHRVHAEQEHGEAAGQSEYRRYDFIHALFSQESAILDNSRRPCAITEST